MGHQILTSPADDADHEHHRTFGIKKDFDFSERTVVLVAVMGVV
jgi:hypothetical protein